MRTKTLAVLSVTGLLALAACGGDDEPADEPAADEPTEEPADEPAADEPSEEPSDEPADEPAGDGTVAGIDLDAVLAADLSSCEAEPTGEPIVVGMAMDFGEFGGFADIPGSEAVAYLAELINCSGGVGGSPVVTEIRDIQGDPQVTAQATQELLDAGAHFLIGPPFADFGQPVLQVTGGEVPVFFAASTEPSLPDASVNSFLVTFDDTKQATAAAEYALEQGFTRAILFSSPGPYFGYNPEIFAEVFTAGGGEIVTDQTYTPAEDVDFSAQVNEIVGLAEGDEVVYSAMLSFQLTALRGQLEAQGLDGLTYMSADAFEATGGLAEADNEGIIHTTHAFAEPGGRIEALVTGYEAAKGQPLDSPTFAGLYADALLVGIQGIVDCGCTEPAEIGAAIAAIEGFDGFTGEMSFAGTNGVPDKPVSIQRVEGGVSTLAAEWGE